MHDPTRSGLPVNSRQREVWQVRAPAASSVIARRCCQWELAPSLLMAAWLVQISTGVIGGVLPRGARMMAGSGVASLFSHTLGQTSTCPLPLWALLMTSVQSFLPSCSQWVPFLGSLWSLPVRRHWLGLCHFKPTGFFNFSFLDGMEMFRVFLQEAFCLLLQNGHIHTRAL